MNEVAFVEKREPDWRRLALLTDQADVGPRNLSPEQLREFVMIYRQVASDLALARTQSSNLQLIEFLNDLVGRAYMCLYRPKRGSWFKAIGTGIASYARTVRKLKAFVFLSIAIFLLGTLGIYGLLKVRPDMRESFIPGQMKEVFRDWTHGEMEERSGSESILATTFYSANNPMVAMVTGAKAVGSFGILTTQALFENGAILGVLGHEVAKVGRLGYLIIRISPHGVTEISGLIFACAGGFAMAWAMINPGRRKRGDALLEAAKDALIVYMGGICLMFLAAPIEGFFSFNPRVPEWAKVTFAIISLIAWIAFYMGYGKEEEQLVV